MNASRLGLLALTIGMAAALATPAHAQTINSKAKEKVRWYNAPREVQIIDDRPIVKDFREAPSAPSSIQLPPGPQGAAGFGGGGAGALGGDGGDTLPAGGMPIGGGGPGYRTDPGSGPVALPKADFGHQPSNIPARGMGPKGPLPGGFTTGIHGKVAPWNAAPPQTVSQAVRGRSSAMPQRPVQTASYSAPGGGYGPSVGTASGAGGATTNVSARLLKKVK
jgi:hypothetical protein